MEIGRPWIVQTAQVAAQLSSPGLDSEVEVASGRPRLPRLGLSRRVSCTNPCTNQFLDCGLLSVDMGQAPALMRSCAGWHRWIRCRAGWSGAKPATGTPSLSQASEGGLLSSPGLARRR